MTEKIYLSLRLISEESLLISTLDVRPWNIFVMLFISLFQTKATKDMIIRQIYNCWLSLLSLKSLRILEWDLKSLMSWREWWKIGFLTRSLVSGWRRIEAHLKEILPIMNNNRLLKHLRRFYYFCKDISKELLIKLSV